MIWLVSILSVALVAGQDEGEPECKVINEDSADLHKYPWLGYITSHNRSPRSPSCEATLITKTHVLTLAHCVENYQQRQLFVQFGVYDWCQRKTIDGLDHWENITDVKLEDFHDDAGRLALAVLAKKIPISECLFQANSANIETQWTYRFPGFGTEVGTVDPQEQFCSLQKALVKPHYEDPICPKNSSWICVTANVDPIFQGSSGIGAAQGAPLVEERCVGGQCKLHMPGAAAYQHNERKNVIIFREVYSALPWIYSVIGTVE